MEIIKKSGVLKTEDELYEEAVELLVDALEDLSEEEQIVIGNAYREMGSPTLYCNDSATVDNEFSDLSPWELLQLGQSWSEYDDYFIYDGDNLQTTDDIWIDADTDDVARAILDGEISAKYMVLANIVEEYKQAKEQIEHYNPWRAMCTEVVKKFTDGTASVADLLQTLDKLAKSEDAWRKE